MDGEEFRNAGKELMELIINYTNSYRDRPVVPSIQPGYLRPQLPTDAPVDGEDFDKVLADIEPLILSGVTNWQHPHFHAYYPTARSYPAILADMLSDAIASIGFSWISSPVYTELETVMTDWLAKALALPAHFQFSNEGKGGGVIQGSASEASLMIFTAARNAAVAKLQQDQPELQPWQILGKLVAYTSDQAHCSIERAAKIAFVQLKQLPTDDRRSLRGKQLREAVEQDIKAGLVPILCAATMGTTSSCAFDNLQEIGEICNEHNIWFHIDAAYAGSALLCPELRYLADGLQLSDSFNYNAHKWMHVTFDCSLLWVKDATKLVEIFNADPVYLQHEFSGLPDYRHWQVPLGRRFRSLKIWFVLRSFGINKLQQRIRKDVQLAKKFQQLIEQDGRFEIVEEVVLGIVCFSLKAGNAATENLYKKIRADNQIHLVASKFDQPEKFFIRFVICSEFTEEDDIQFAYDVIRKLSDQL